MSPQTKPPVLCLWLCPFGAPVLAGGRAATGTFRCTFFCSAKTNPTWQEPGGSHRNARRSGAPSAKAWLRQGRREGSYVPPSAPGCVLAQSQRCWYPTRPSGRPHQCWVPGVRKPSGREPWGTKGPLLWSFICYQLVADGREAPDLSVRSPSPQPREPRSGSGPPCSRRAPGCGIRGQIRRRFVLATQTSWIGKWGWGVEIDPAVPERGSAWSWGLWRGLWAVEGVLGLQFRGHGPAWGGRGHQGRAWLMFV